MNCEYHMTKATFIVHCVVCGVSGRDTEQSDGIMEANRLISAGEVIALNLIFSRITFRPWPAHSRSLCYITSKLSSIDRSGPVMVLEAR